MNSKDIEHTYHITTRLSDGDAGDTRTFWKKSTLTIGGQSQLIADTRVTVIRIQSVSFYTEQKMAVLYISATPINKHCKTLPKIWIQRRILMNKCKHFLKLSRLASLKSFPSQ
jgi:hypothetical protein